MWAIALPQGIDQPLDGEFQGLVRVTVPEASCSQDGCSLRQLGGLITCETPSGPAAGARFRRAPYRVRPWSMSNGATPDRRVELP